MEREVDRLLAGLSNFGSQTGRAPASPAVSSNSYPVERRRVPRPSRPAEVSNRADRIGLWARLLLGIVLGAALTQWPYPRGCGGPLLAYLGAVAMVIVAGIWIAVSAWKLRAGVVHILALILLFSGVVLAAERVLPRIGYAAERAAWHC